MYLVVDGWRHGAPDTFDPKRYSPYKEGLEISSMLSTFPAIRTRLSITSDLRRAGEHCAGDGPSHADSQRGPARLGQHPALAPSIPLHTGYVPPQTVACRTSAHGWPKFSDRAIRSYLLLNIGQRLEGFGETEEIKAFTTAGFFGSEFGPMNLPFPEEAAQSVKPPKGMDAQRFANRDKLFKRLVDASPQRDVFSDYQRQSMLRSLDNAYRLLSSKERDAFDISLEPAEVRAKYDTGRFGRVVCWPGV